MYPLKEPIYMPSPEGEEPDVVLEHVVAPIENLIIPYLLPNINNIYTLMEKYSFIILYNIVIFYLNLIIDLFI